MVTVPLPPIRYTLCFLTRPGQVLLLHRRRPPNQGLWNGVGGHIEPGETPRQSVLREIWEETGYQLSTVRFGGLLTWTGFEIPAGGICLFSAPAPDQEPAQCMEGELAWFPLDEAFTAPQVVSNIHVFGPRLLSKAEPTWYHFDYRAGQILAHTERPLPDQLANLSDEPWPLT